MRKGPGYEPCQNREKKSGGLDELATARARLLEKASAWLEKQAKNLELSGQPPSRIILPVAPRVLHRTDRVPFWSKPARYE